MIGTNCATSLRQRAAPGSAGAFGKLAEKSLGHFVEDCVEVVARDTRMAQRILSGKVKRHRQRRCKNARRETKRFGSRAYFDRPGIVALKQVAHWPHSGEVTFYQKPATTSGKGRHCGDGGTALRQLRQR